MSNMLFPVPVDTPILMSNTQFNITWQKYLKAVGDDLLTANKIITIDKDFNYTINGNQCFYNYYRTSEGDISIQLPYKSALPFKISNVLYIKGTNRIIIPSTIDFLQDFYFIDFSR